MRDSILRPSGIKSSQEARLSTIYGILRAMSLTVELPRSRGPDPGSAASGASSSSTTTTTRSTTWPRRLPATSRACARRWLPVRRPDPPQRLRRSSGAAARRRGVPTGDASRTPADDGSARIRLAAGSFLSQRSFRSARIWTMCDHVGPPICTVGMRNGRTAVGDELPREVALVLRPVLPEVADEVIGAVRTVPAYSRPLDRAFGEGIRAGSAAGSGSLPG